MMFINISLINALFLTSSHMLELPLYHKLLISHIMPNHRITAQRLTWRRRDSPVYILSGFKKILERPDGVHTGVEGTRNIKIFR